MHDESKELYAQIMERFLFDAVEELLRHEDEDKFFAWMHRNATGYFNALGDDFPADGHLADMLARLIWDVTPLPGNNFQTRPTVAPQRNQPCPCGSGKKYKKCCLRLEANRSPITSAQMWPLVLQLLPPAEIQRACDSGNAPVEGLGAAAEILMAEDKPKKALQIIEPLFRSPANFKKEAMGDLFEMAISIYEQLGYSGKKTKLIDQIIEVAPKSALRCAAYQRRAVICMDAGDEQEAWRFFRLAQQDKPDDLSNGLLEMNLLAAQARYEQIKARAEFWLKKCRKLSAVDKGVEDFFFEASRDPKGLFSDIAIDMAGGAGDRLKEWLAEVSGRQLPRYTTGKETFEMPGPPPAAKKPPKQISLFEPIVEEQDDPSDQQAEAQEEEAMVVPRESIILEPPEPVRAVEEQWRRRFNFPKPFSVHLQTRGEFDPWEPRLEEKWCDFLAGHPEAFDSLDILDDIVGAVEIHPESMQSWILLELVPDLLQRACAIIRLALADEPDAEMSWLINDNRPALRLLYKHYLFTMYHGAADEKLASGQWLLRLNPADNHGVREDIVNDLLKAGADEQALAVAKNYTNDLILATSLGKALALYRLQRLKEAEKALGEAIRRNRYAVDFLVRARVAKPEISEIGVNIGGKDQAWMYRQDMRSTWEMTPGALDWLKKTAARL